MSEGGSDVTSGQTSKSRSGIIQAIEVNHPIMVEHAGAKHEYWGRHHLGGSLILALNTSLWNAALTHNGFGGNCSRGVDGARATQEGGRAGLNGGRGVAGLDHGVDDVGGSAAAVGGDCCLQSWQLIRTQYEIAVVWGGELTDHLALADRQALPVWLSGFKAVCSHISPSQAGAAALELMFCHCITTAVNCVVTRYADQ